jgi:hypothetical protein
MHVLAIPSRVQGYRADELHPAKAAQRAARAQGAAPGVARAEGRKTLKAVLDRFHAEVGDRFGLRRRISESPQPRVARQQIIEDRKRSAQSSSNGVPAEPVEQVPGPREIVGERPWSLADFVPGADGLLASLSPDWRHHARGQGPTHDEDFASGPAPTRASEGEADP